MKTNENYEIENGVLVKCLDKNVVEVVVPEGIGVIIGRAFYGCKNLKSITLPKSLYAINKDAFLDCDKLISVNFALNPLYNIKCLVDKDAFKGCVSLKSDYGKMSRFALCDRVMIENNIVVENNLYNHKKVYTRNNKTGWYLSYDNLICAPEYDNCQTQQTYSDDYIWNLVNNEISCLYIKLKGKYRQI